MAGFLLWMLLLVFCWPLALLALVLYPIVWLLMLPYHKRPSLRVYSTLEPG